jgi:Protein of unknown function (DUF1559)
LNEPWNSPHNMTLLTKMPKVFAHPNAAPGTSPSSTYYRVFTGPATPFRDNQGMRIAEITDGLSNTIGIVEAADPVPWTKPDDLPYNPQGPLPRLGGRFPGGFHVAMFDCTVKFLPSILPEQTLRAMITPNGGEVVPLP